MNNYTERKTLALGDRYSSSYKAIRQALLLFKNLSFINENKFTNADQVIDFIQENDFEEVLMPNPYGQKRRFFIYEKLNSIGIPTIVFDRGGLPNSFFFDRGFNSDSDSYNISNWDIKLERDSEENTINYINSTIASSQALEKQGERIGGNALKELLGIGNKKILFVPMQRPNDTTVKYFSKNVKDIYDFCKQIYLATEIIEKNKDWIVLSKKHPLETVHPDPRLKYIPDDTHIHDILEISDAVTLINSGTGLISACFGKPVYYFGETYYGHPKINRQVKDYEDLAACVLGESQIVDQNKVIRLIHHLTTNVYSFGEIKEEISIERNGSLRNILRSITFDEIRFPTF